MPPKKTSSVPMLLNRERAWAVMDKHKLDGLLAATQINIYYLTNFWGAMMKMRRSFFNYAILPRDPRAPAALILTAAEIARLSEMPTWVPNVVTYSHPALTRMRDYDTETEEPQAGNPLRWPIRKSGLTAREKGWITMTRAQAARIGATPAFALRRALRDAGLEAGRLGTDDPRPIQWMNEMGLRKLKGVEATNIFREIRMVKSPAEIRIIREAARINEEGVNAAIRGMKAGMTTADLETSFNVAVAKMGGTAVYMSCGGGGLPHGKVIRGEPVMFDGLATYKHYHGDIGRTAVVGKPSAEIVKRNKAMTIGWETAFETIRPGVMGREMTTKVLAAMDKAGFPGFIVATPHSIGLEHTDHPLPIGTQLPGSRGDLVFEENMIINVDLPFHEYGWGSMHLEDMVRITKNGCEPLTTMKTGLRVK